jgi:predicted lipoprotein with Yx(FWY)xxD motif
MTLTTRTHRLRPALLLAGLAVAAAGCGSASSNRSAETSPSAPPKAGTVVMVRTVGKLGPVLVDSNGRTLYLFLKDAPGKSTCSSTCTQVWPPLTSAGTPTAGPGASSALLGTSPDANGTRQVTYAGHPLYLYVSDTQPGQATGQGLDQFGAEWYALSSHGDKVEGSGSTDGSAHY